MRTLNLTSVLLGLCCLLGIASSVWAQYPDPSNAPTNFPLWWFEQGVIVPSNPTNASPTWPGDYPTSDDYSLINQGQLKNLAVAALAEIQTQFPPNILTNSNAIALANLVNGWTTNPSSTADNYAAVNQGQLKAIAAQFYDVLGEGSYTAGHGFQPTNWHSGTYPWSTNSHSPDSYAAVVIGQAKYLFSFDLEATNGQIPAWWAAYYGISVSDPNANAPSGDGNTFLEDYQQHISPTDFYRGAQPSLSFITGAGQHGSPGILTIPLSVQINANWQSPAWNAPVTITVQSGHAMLSLNGGTPASFIPLRTTNSYTDANGNTYTPVGLVSIVLPNISGDKSVITATASYGNSTTSISTTEFVISTNVQMPGNFHAVPSSPTTALLSWTSSNTNYPTTVEISYDEGTNWSYVQTVPAGQVNTTVSNLTPDQTVSFRVYTGDNN